MDKLPIYLDFIASERRFLHFGGFGCLTTFDRTAKCYFYQITLHKRRFKGIRFYAKIKTCYLFLYNRNDTYRFLEKLSGVTRWPGH